MTLVTQQSQMNQEILVSYIVALHVWFAVCIFFIFMALIELAMALLYAQKVTDKKDEEERRKQRLMEEEALRVQEELTGGGVCGSCGTAAATPATPTLTHAPHSFAAHMDRENSVTSFSNAFNGSAVNADTVRRMSRDQRARLRDKRPSVISLGAEKVSKKSSHLIKLLLTYVYGQVDWRKSPRERNKIDYVARVFFPSAFLLFVIVYFTYLILFTTARHHDRFD